MLSSPRHQGLTRETKECYALWIIIRDEFSAIQSLVRLARRTRTFDALHSHKGLGPPGTPARHEATDETIPCVFKDITLPGGLDLENIRCALGEDVVAVFVVGIPSLLMVRYEGSHSVQGFYCTFLPFSTDREYFLSPHLGYVHSLSFSLHFLAFL